MPSINLSASVVQEATSVRGVATSVRGVDTTVKQLILSYKVQAASQPDHTANVLPSFEAALRVSSGV